MIVNSVDLEQNNTQNKCTCSYITQQLGMRAKMARRQKRTHAKCTHWQIRRKRFHYVDAETRGAAQDDSFFLFRRPHARLVMI